MTRDMLIEAFEFAKRNKIGICAEIQIGESTQSEYIINDYSNLDDKLKYYLKTYNDMLVMENNPNIIICDVYPVIVNNSGLSLVERINVENNFTN